MSNPKYYLASLGLLGLALCATPAAADPITPVTVSNVQVDWNQGEGTTMTPAGSIYYAGPILFTIGGKSTVVWCDDLYNDVYIGSSDQYYETDANDANAYLWNSSLSSADQTTLDQGIAGLAYEGTILAQADALNSTSGAQYQAAIWELEYSGLNDPDSTFQAGVDTLLEQAAGDYTAMLAANYTYGELEAPGCNQLPGSITYTNSCQTQGQIFVHDPVPAPEPITISLFGAGLAGAVAMRRRKKTKTA